MKYICNICKKEFNKKCNYTSHISRKITCKPIINEILDLNNKNIIEGESNVPEMYHDILINVPKCTQNVPLDKTVYKCLVCHKKFKFSQGLSRHKRSHDNYEVDCKNIINDINNNKINMIEQELMTTKLKLEEVLNTLNTKQISTNNNTTNTNTNSNNNINANTNVNIFTDFGQEKLEMLTLEDRKDICSQPCDSIFKIVQKMHVNKDLPDYMNICVENLRSNIMYAIEKNKFIAKDKSITLFDVIHTAGYRLREILTNEENTKDISDERKESLKTLYNFILRYDPDNEDLDGNKIKSSQDTMDNYNNKQHKNVHLITYDIKL
jgi:DNA-directed RNA polymerase subunit RPC12/RpoP